MAAENKTSVLFEILSNEQQILQRTDQKAFTLLSILGVFSVFFIVHYTKIPPDIFNLILITLYFLSVLISIVFLLLVISPRIKDIEETIEQDKKAIIPTFFGGIIKYSSSAEYAKTLDTLLENPNNTYEIFAKSVYSIGRINAYKNKYFRKGIVLFSIAITLELIIIVSIYVRMVI
ncbi:MAG: Pycsar system effector family protein [Ignavibacteriaceae bacterium]